MTNYVVIITELVSGVKNPCSFAGACNFQSDLETQNHGASSDFQHLIQASSS